MNLPLDGDGAAYLQVYRALRGRILAGELPPGARLPASRALAAELGRSRNVILAAYGQLFAEGYLQGKVGSGTYVASPLPEALLQTPAAAAPPRPRRARAPRLSAYAGRALRQAPVRPPGTAAPPPRYDFRYGMAEPDPASLSAWRKLVARHAGREPRDYGPPAGHPPLCAAIAAYMRRNRGVACEPRQVLVVSGSQQGLDLAARVLLDPGDRVLIEEPHYQGARHVFLSAGARLVPVPVDEDGLDVAAAPAAARRARLAYVTPSHQFPTGAVLPAGRRLALLEWARRGGAYVLEDDYDSEYRYAGRPIGAVAALDRGGRTIYVGTFSKVLFPSLRLGFLVLPPALIEAFRAAKWMADRHSSILEQAVLADFLEEGHFDRHLRRMRRVLAARRAALLAALDECLGERAEVVGTDAGIHVVVRIRGFGRRQVERLVRLARRRDVGVYPIAPYYLRPPSGAGLLFGYGTLCESDVPEGVRRLSAAAREVRAGAG